MEEEWARVVLYVILRKNFLYHCLRLAGQIRLISGQLILLNNDAISGHGVALLQQNDVAYDKLLGVDGAHGVITTNTRRHFIAALHKLLEFGLLGHIVSNRHNYDDKDCNYDRHAIDPAE